MHMVHFLWYLRNEEGATDYGRKACHTRSGRVRGRTDLFEDFFSLCMKFKRLWIHMGYAGAHWDRWKRKVDKVDEERGPTDA
jgi:hypothetical protein